MPVFPDCHQVSIHGGTFVDISSSDSKKFNLIGLDSVSQLADPSVSGVNAQESLSQSDSDIFAEELLVKKHGYPLWKPDPRCWGDHIPLEYISSGVRIGDVGVVTNVGSFDCIFNVYLPLASQDPINHKGVPDDFSPLTWSQSNIRSQSLKHGLHTAISSPGISRQAIPPRKSQCQEGGLGMGYTFQLSGPGTVPELLVKPSTTTRRRNAGFKFTSQSPRGAILVLPDGGSSIELVNLGEIRMYAERNAVSWYMHINGRLGREIPNGSLYVITGVDKCTSWGVASFSNPAKERLSLHFLESYSDSTDFNIPSSEKYYWEEDRVPGATGPDTFQTTPNQCLFLRGYRIALQSPRAHVLPITNMTPRELRAERDSEIPFGVDWGYFSPNIPGVSSDNREEQRYMQMPSRPYHPADVINTCIIDSNKKVQVSLVHDNDWTSVIKDSDTQMPDDDTIVQRMVKEFGVVVEQDGHAHLQCLPIARHRDASYRPVVDGATLKQGAYKFTEIPLLNETKKGNADPSLSWSGAGEPAAAHPLAPSVSNQPELADILATDDSSGARPSNLQPVPRNPANSTIGNSPSTSKHKAVKVSVNNLSSDDIIIVVMGPTGVGKSTFIDLATEQGGKTIGNKLESYTADVQSVRISHPSTGQSIVFVDTPGFDDSNKSNAEVLRIIAQWLEKTYKRNIKLAGIIYMHRISDSRMAGSPQKDLRVFANLCGDEAMHNVILATTMWNRVDEDLGTRRETELKQKYWKPMLEKKSTVVRFYGTFQSAWSIVDVILRSTHISPLPLLLQKEMVDFHKRLSETKAGITLNEELRNLLSLHKGAVQKLQEEAQKQNNPLLVKELDAQSEEIQEKIRQTLDQMQEMRIPFGRRIRSLFSFGGPGKGR